MSQYRNDLLAPFLALPQGEKIQAECEHSIHHRPFASPLTIPGT